jgi:hypothetical protein
MAPVDFLGYGTPSKRIVAYVTAVGDFSVY